MNYKWLTVILGALAAFYLFHYYFINCGHKHALSGINKSFENTGINIWFEENSRRIGQKESAKNLPHIWDGRKVYLSAAGNEYEPFQLILSSHYDVKNIRIRVSDLINGDNIIAGDNFKIYKVHYVSAKSYGMLADPLVPLKKTIDLVADKNQPLWIRLYVPLHTVSGDYRGEISVLADGLKQKIPIKFHVWDFSLPERSTLFRVSPHWKSSSFVKETYGLPDNYKELVYLFYKELKRAGISPANSFDLKGVGTDGYREDKGVITIDFSNTDDRLRNIFEEHKLNYIDVDFYYSPVGHYDKHRNYPFEGVYEDRISRYVSLIADHYREKEWFSRMWIQHYGDEPCQTCKGGEHLHPSYEFIKEWSVLSHSAAPDLKILLSEHPTPQLTGSVDIWNVPWHLLKRADVKERHEAGEMVITYSCDSKIKHPLINERINLWNIFSEEADGCWSWHLYRMGDFLSDDDSRRYAMFYDGRSIGIADEPVISLRSEMMGEAKEDWEYLKLIEEKFGRNMALSIANIVAERPGPLGNGKVDEEGLYAIREFIGKKLEMGERFFQEDFHNLDLISEAKNLEIDMTNEGSVYLDFAEPPVMLERFEDRKRWTNRGPVKAEVRSDKRTEGDSSVRVIFRKGKKDPRQFSFSMTELPVRDWSDYDMLEFDVYSEAPLSLFDISINFNNEYGRGYYINGSVDWQQGDQVHSLGIFSLNGSFPGKWRNIRIDFANLSGRYRLPEGRTRINSLHFRMGSGGSVNEPLPDTDYIIYIDNMRLWKKVYKLSGEIVSTPVQVAGRANYIEWITDYKTPPGTSLQFFSRSGATAEYDPSSWGEWKPAKIESLFNGRLMSSSLPYLQYKALFTSDGNETPELRGITIYRAEL